MSVVLEGYVLTRYSGFLWSKAVDIKTQGMINFSCFLLLSVVMLSQLGFSFASVGFRYTLNW